MISTINSPVAISLCYRSFSLLIGCRMMLIHSVFRPRWISFAALCLLGTLQVASTAVAQLRDAAHNSLTLRTAVGDRYKIGVGVSDNIPTRMNDWELLTTQFQIVTPENSMKPQGIQPREGEFRFEECDRFVQFAKSKGLEIVGHCLVWAKDDRTSEWWLTEDGQPTSKEKLLERLKTHIDTVVGRYGNDVTMWDVVNEALEDGDGSYLRDSIWTRVTGEEFMVKAFQWTREKAPKALLIYNDYNNEYPGKLEKTLKLIRSLREQGAPVDALGIQGHFELDTIRFDALENLLNQCREEKIQVVISELDIDVVPRSRWWADGGKYRDEMSKLDPYKDGCPPEILQRQAEQYAKLFQLFNKHSDVIARVSFWNLHDGESWLNYFPWNRTNHPLLFDRQGQAKPAFEAVLETLK
ncbi:endo-1,4-beta-xylanase [Pirellulaceae bacterium SH449]